VSEQENRVGRDLGPSTAWVWLCLVELTFE